MDNIKKIEKQLDLLLNTYYWCDLQSTIDINEDVSMFLVKLNENDKLLSNSQISEEYGALSYNIGCLIEVLEYKRGDDFSCKDLDFLKQTYNYCNILSNLYKQKNENTFN